MHTKEKLLEVVELGVTQQQIADIAGVAQSNISRIGSGDIKNPSSEIVEVISQVYQHVCVDHKKMKDFPAAQSA